VRFDKVKRLINLGGATRFNEINDKVSHVVLLSAPVTGLALPHDITTSHGPHVVCVQWLLESFRSGFCQPAEPYLIDLGKGDAAPVRSTAIMGKDGLSDKRKINSVGASEQIGKKEAALQDAQTDAEDMNQLLSQYLPAADVNKGVSINNGVRGGGGGGSSLYMGSSLSESELIRAAEEGSQNRTVTEGRVEGREEDDATLYVPPLALNLEERVDQGGAGRENGRREGEEDEGTYDADVTIGE